MSQSLADQTMQTPKAVWRRNWLTWAVVLLLLFGAYLLAGIYWAPRLIRSQAVSWVKTNLNKSIAMGEIKVNPLSFKVDISDIAVPAAANSSPMVAVSHVRVGFSPLSLFEEAYRLTELRIDRPFVQATIRPDGSLNLLELVPPSHGGESPAFRIDIFSVDQGRIAYADKSRPSGPEETLVPITFTLRDFHTKKNEGGEFTLDGKSERGEGFAWRGTVSMAPIASQGRFTITDLQATTIAKFLGDRLPVTLTAGRIGVDGSYGFSYAAGSMRLVSAIPRLALNGLAFDGKDKLLHATAQVDQAVASLNFSFAAGAKAPAPTAALSHLTLHGVTLAGTGPVKGETIRLADGTLDNAKLDTAGHRLDLGSISLGGLDLPVAREKNNVISLVRWLAIQPESAQPQMDQPQPGANAAPWSAQLGTFTLTDAAVHFQDRTVTPAARYDLAPIALTATGAGTDMTKPVTISLSAGINSKGQFKADGVVTPSTHEADLKLSLTGLPLKPAAGYLPYPAVELRSGDLSFSGTLTMPAGDKAAPHFKGEAAIDNLSLHERVSGSELFSWRGLKITGIDYRPGHVDIARARVLRPVGGIAILADRSFNFTPLMAPKIAVPAAAPTGAAPAMAFKLKALDIEGGTLGFADHSIDPAFQARIEALQGSIRNIASAPDQIAAIDLKGQVIDRFSPVTIAGTANLLGYDKNTDIQVAFRNIELPIFNPYSGRYAGYAIAKGKLTTEMHYRIVNRALQADHHIVIDQLEWGQASANKPSAPWPVGLVTSLLKDRHGMIDLNLPVKGSLDDPTFRLGPIIWQIIGNLIEKVVTAPFALIGSLFEGADKAQYIDFAPGSAVMPAGSADSLAALAKGLGDRPALQLDIPAAPAPKEDAVTIADSRIDQLVMAGEIKKGQKTDFASLDAEDQHDRLADLYRAKIGKRPAYPEALPALDAKPASGQPQSDQDQQRQMQETVWLRGELRNAFLPSNAELATLGSARATAVRDALLAKGDIEPTRVFLVTGQAATAANGQMRLELKLR